MGFLDKFKKTFIINRKNDEILYSVVAKEMADGIRNEAHWLKALELSDGNKDKQVSEYIKLRVQSLKDDINIANTLLKDNLAFEKNSSNKLIKPLPDIEELISIIEEKGTIFKIEDLISNLNTEEIKIYINSPDACEEYPLHVSIKNNRLDILEWLLNAGANPNIKNSWDKTALDMAIAKEDIDAELLINKY